MNAPSNCPFCTIVGGDDPEVREVARNDSVVVFFPTEPAVLGHCMVIPRRHVEEISDLTSDEVTQVMLAVQMMTKSLREAYQPVGVNIIQSNGDAASQSVPHVHVHVVPRWKGDRVGKIWPPESDFPDTEKDFALAKLRAVTVLSSSAVNPEDKRQHLSFAQSIITRMAQSSSSVKSWLLPVATAAYGYSFTQSSVAVAVLGIVATVVFGVLDIGYLRTERKFRRLYDRIAAGDPNVRPYSLNFKDAGNNLKGDFLEHCSTIIAWPIWPFYGALLATGVVALVMAL
ncbi:HIT domain-containing protein [Cutibacterium sp. V970]|uniref:HIT family protein n=1 Tax=Cutibacterium sp. V970 TaxID=3446481 RepID=UPI003EE28AD3